MSEVASSPRVRAAQPRTAEADPPSESPPAPVVDEIPASTVAGATLGMRYRLHTRVGSDVAAGAEFWQAKDTVLQRDVAITLLHSTVAGSGALGGDDAPTAAERAREMLDRALRSGNFEHSGCARLLDVLAPDAPGIPVHILGAAVTEWVPGRSLAETVADAPLWPIEVARALQPLAAAAEAAHRHGLVLGCDQPQRIRMTVDGRVQLCFALPRPDLNPADDVRGLGAVLVTLLTSRWPLSGADAARAGLAVAERAAGGALPAPSAERSGVPIELDALAAGTLGPEDAPGHVHTAAAVHRLLTEVLDEYDRVLLPPDHDGRPAAPGEVWQDGTGIAAPPDPLRRRKLAVGLAALGSCVLIVLGYIGFHVGGIFGDTTTPTIVVGETVGPSVASSGGAPAQGGVAAVAGIEVYDRTGDRDNRGRVSRVIDGDLSSGWRTFVYRQQFPALKPGVGLMVSFVSPVQLSGLSISSPSRGSRMEIRAAPTDDAAFADTVTIAETTLDDRNTSVSLAESQPVQYVLLWITELGGGGTEHVTEITEVEFRRAVG